jgi:hypothetical protein
MMAKGESGNEKGLEPQKLYEQMFGIDDENDFEIVEQVFDVAGGAKREESAFSVNRSGWAKTNVNGATDTVSWLQSLGLDPYTIFFVSGVNRRSGRVALYPSNSQPAGAVAPKWSKDRKTFMWHFGASLDEAPELRPTTDKVQAPMAFGKDRQGRQCIMVKLKGAAPKRRGAADPEEMLARAVEEEAKKANKQAIKEKIARIKGKGTDSQAAQPAAGAQEPTEGE